MFSWFKRPPTIHVEYIDEATGKPFAQCRFPLDRLPESFELATTMNRDGQDWQILRANPMTKPEFARTRKLQLLVRKVQAITAPISDILFSLPTISDELPANAPDTSRINRNILDMHEDDWRQIEFVSLHLKAAIDICLNRIAEIHETRVGHAFKTCHPRKEIPAPLADQILTLDNLRTTFSSNTTWLDGISFRDHEPLVAGGFALRLLSSLELYGLATAGEIHVLALHSTRPNNAARDDIPRLAYFAATHNLALIDWCTMQLIPPDPAAFTDYFTAESA